MVRTRRTVARMDLAESQVQTLVDVGVEEAVKVATAVSSDTRYVKAPGLVVSDRGTIPTDDGEFRFSPYGFKRACSALGVRAGFIEDLYTVSPDTATEALTHTLRHSRNEGMNFAIQGTTIEGVVSDRYSRLGNDDVIGMASQVMGSGDFKAVSFEIGRAHV